MQLNEIDFQNLTEKQKKILFGVIGVGVVVVVLGVLLLLNSLITPVPELDTSLGQTPQTVPLSGEFNDGFQGPVDSGAGSGGGSLGSCDKLGINFAVHDVVEQDYKKAAKYSMGSSLQIANSPDQLDQIAQDFKLANSYNVIPVLRACAVVNPEECGFRDANIYVQFIDDLAQKLGNNGEFMVLLGPNEPLTEPWTGGVGGEPFGVGPSLATYMNNVIEGLKNKEDQSGANTKANVLLASPAFNCTNPGVDDLVNAMNGNNANFEELDMIAGNAYNMNTSEGYTMSYYIDLAKSKFPGKKIILTEGGMIETSDKLGFGVGLDRSTAFANLLSEVQKMKSDPDIVSVLLFDSFGNNAGDADGDGKADFEFNFLNDEELAQLAGANCVKSEDEVVPEPIEEDDYSQGDDGEFDEDSELGYEDNEDDYAYDEDSWEEDEDFEDIGDEEIEYGDEYLDNDFDSDSGGYDSGDEYGDSNDTYEDSEDSQDNEDSEYVSTDPGDFSGFDDAETSQNNLTSLPATNLSDNNFLLIVLGIGMLFLGIGLRQKFFVE